MAASYVGVGVRLGQRDRRAGACRARLIHGDSEAGGAAVERMFVCHMSNIAKRLAIVKGKVETIFEAAA